ncbi:organic cation transporter -like [Paramuricea clavata]|uniref:Organic cation transporter -like n=1 Tax=Paramuricea clavata TaxID=317549 RepID=A0A6S7FZR5_PARCT|nr:organic cation transporter -like [Paramuricea clavata]
MHVGVLMVIVFVLLTEYTSARHRAKLGIYLFNFWSAGLLLLALLAYLLPNWRDLLLASAAMGTPCLCYWWLTPESIRWLLVRDKYDEAIKYLAKIAKVNKKELPDEEVKRPDVVEEGSFRHLFLNLETTKKSLIVFDIWATVGLVYYGVSYSSVDLGWNPYVAFALTGAIEFPSNFGTVWAADRYGRKKTTALNLICACVAAVAVVMIPSDQSKKASVNTIFRIIMAVFAKFFITNAYASSYVWAAELFPTFIRSMALSFGSVATIVGSICASYVIWLIRIHPMLPYGIMAFFCLQSSFVAMFLPETNGQPTLETILDMKPKSVPTLNENGQDDCIQEEKLELVSF